MRDRIWSAALQRDCVKTGEVGGRSLSSDLGIEWKGRSDISCPYLGFISRSNAPLRNAQGVSAKGEDGAGLPSS